MRRRARMESSICARSWAFRKVRSCTCTRDTWHRGRNIALILRAFAQVEDVHVVFVGAGALLPEVERAAATHPNIHRLPPVEPDQVLAMTRGADVALCLIESGCLSHRLSTPNKMMEAFAAGVPALCSPLAEARRYLAIRPRHGCWKTPSTTSCMRWTASRERTSTLSGPR